MIDLQLARRSARAALLANAIACSLWATPAIAQSKDAAAVALEQDAMGRDYVATQFATAEKKLRKALALCGKSACSTQVRARLLRDLGVVLMGGLQRKDDARAAFAEARALDPKLTLDKDLRTPELQRLFDEAADDAAKKLGGETTPAPAVAHEPPAEQKTNTPVPLYVEVPADSDVARVRVRFRATDSDAWKTASMKRVGDGFGIEIDCANVRQVGELAYYLEMLDDTGAVVASSGSKDEPHVVQVKDQIDGVSPHLPGKRPPAVCSAEDAEEPRTTGSRKNNWLGVAVQQDVALVGSDAEICSFDKQSSGTWTCFRGSGTQYHGAPQRGVNDRADGGPTLATTRILLSYDRVLGANVTVGARVGYAFRGAPKPDGHDAVAFLPLHAEVRGSYWFGTDPFAQTGLRPFVSLAAGAAEVDAKASTTVTEDTSVPPPAEQLDNPPKQTLDAWRRMGQVFVGAGAGAMYALTPSSGLTAEVRWLQLLPTSGSAVALQVGYVFGI